MQYLLKGAGNPLNVPQGGVEGTRRGVFERRISPAEFGGGGSGRPEGVISTSFPGSLNTQWRESISHEARPLALCLLTTHRLFVAFARLSPDPLLSRLQFRHIQHHCQLHGTSFCFVSFLLEDLVRIQLLYNSQRLTADFDRCALHTIWWLFNVPLKFIEMISHQL